MQWYAVQKFKALQQIRTNIIIAKRKIEFLSKYETKIFEWNPQSEIYNFNGDDSDIRATQWVIDQMMPTIISAKPEAIKYLHISTHIFVNLSC